MLGKIIAFLVAFLAGLVGGGATPAPEPAPASSLYAPVGDDAAPLGGNVDALWGTWVSTVNPIATVTFSRQEGGLAVSVYAGCNRINAPGSVSDSRLVLAGVQSTAMYCADTDEIEDDLVELVVTAPQVLLGGNGDTLYLVGADGAAPFSKKP